MLNNHFPQTFCYLYTFWIPKTRVSNTWSVTNRWSFYWRCSCVRNEQCACSNPNACKEGGVQKLVFDWWCVLFLDGVANRTLMLKDRAFMKGSVFCGFGRFDVQYALFWIDYHRVRNHWSSQVSEILSFEFVVVMWFYFFEIFSTFWKDHTFITDV